MKRRDFLKILFGVSVLAGISALLREEKDDDRIETITTYIPQEVFKGANKKGLYVYLEKNGEDAQIYVARKIKKNIRRPRASLFLLEGELGYNNEILLKKLYSSTKPMHTYSYEDNKYLVVDFYVKRFPYDQNLIGLLDIEYFDQDNKLKRERYNFEILKGIIKF